MISVRCPSCSAGLKAPSGLAGKKAKCPKCGHAVSIEANQGCSLDDVVMDIMGSETQPLMAVLKAREEDRMQREAAFAAKQRAEAERKRAEVKRDQIYYCQACGARKAKRTSGTEYAVCSPECSRRFEFFNSDVVIVSSLEEAAAAEHAMAVAEKFCPWCGTKMPYRLGVCGNCGGEQQFSNEH